MYGGSYHSRAVKAVPEFRKAGAITGDYTRHDLRRTVATGLEALGFPTSTIAHVLNQQEGGHLCLQAPALDTDGSAATDGSPVPKRLK